MIAGLKDKLDYGDYAGIPPDRSRYEIMDGDLYVTPAPGPAHQRMVKRLYEKLAAYFEGRGLGEVFFAPIDLILTNHDVVQPDLVVVSDPTQVSQRGIEGIPHLVVEIVSPSTRNQDRAIKSRRYAELGIPHYWIGDPATRGLQCYRLDRRQYALVVQGEGDATVQHPDFPGLTLDLSVV
jgi:Uma2 family endonuclease